MKNIETILSDFGITIPEGKATDLRKAVAENYKTVAEFTKLQERQEGRCRREAAQYGGHVPVGKALRQRHHARKHHGQAGDSTGV